MKVTMVKKVKLDGQPCAKCAQAEEHLKAKGLWAQVDHVAIADEADANSEGMRLAAQHGVEIAPFFLIDNDGDTTLYKSVIQLARTLEKAKPSTTPASVAGADPAPEALVEELEGQAPQLIVSRVLELFGKQAVIAFSGAEDVALIEMAKASGHPFSVFCLDTGRLHPETYRFIEDVRVHYDTDIELFSPDRIPLEHLVQKKGLFSFYEDGHQECCGIRKVEPLRRALAGRRAWLTGQRRDQSPTRSDLGVVELGTPLKFNPLAHVSLGEIWQYLRDHGAPTNPLHERGFVSIGCEPCTRAVRPGEHERAGRWWWEEATKRECGLHRGER